MVLLRVEHLEQGRRGVPAEVHRHLVDLVEQEHRVERPGLLHHLDDLAREGADVGAPVAANLGLVADPAQRQPDELAVRGARDRLGQGGLADAGRAGQRENGAARLPHQAADGQELEDAVLDLLETVVVLVEDALRAPEVAPLAAPLEPGHGNQPVQVVARDRGLRRHRRHRLEPLELLGRLLLDLARHLALVDLLAKLVDLVAAVLLPTQLLLDRLHLLVEVVLLLRLLHLLLHARLDAAVHLELVDLDLENAGDAHETLERGDDLQEILLLLDAHDQVRGDGVGQLARVVHAHGGDHRVVLQGVRQLDVLLEERDDPAHRAFDVAVLLRRPRQHLGDDAVEALVLLPLHRARAIDALDEHLDVAVRQLQALDDVGDATHGEDVARARIVLGRILLGRQEDPLVLCQRVLERPRRRGTPDDERHHHVGKDDDVPEGHDRQRFVDFHVIRPFRRA